MTENQASLNLNDVQMTKLDSFPRAQLLKVIGMYDQANRHLNDDIKKLLAERGIAQHEILRLMEQRLLLRNELFGVSAETSKIKDPDADASDPGTEDKSEKPKKEKVQKPSLRYPELSIIKQTVSFESDPSCKGCAEPMVKINSFETSEFIEVITRSFYITKQNRQKYKCGACDEGGIVTAPVVPRVTAGGSYGDGFAVEVAAEKYCSHVPIHRIVNEMRHQGLKDIESRTLIEQTHNLADFLREVYRELKSEVRLSPLLYADETRWRQMEDKEKRSWYLWGFFTLTSAFYKAHPSRSKDGANDVLKESKAKYLMVDGYTGYNKPSKSQGIVIVNCWAHVRRRFYKAELSGHKPATEFLKLIKKLYETDALAGDDILRKAFLRKEKSEKVLEQLQSLARATVAIPGLELANAIAYMNRYWRGLSLFVTDPLIPLDNNLSERAIHGPVVGRKNYYGNHSEKGAETSAILLSICESAKMNGLDPRKYMLWAVKQKHQGVKPLTPAQIVLQKINIDPVATQS